MKITFPLLILFVVRSALSIRITSNGLQRVQSGNVGILKWTIDEPIVNYTIFNQTTGSPTALREYSHHNYDSTSGEITLTINDVQLWDAGNYSLQITQAMITLNDSTACLYVYGNLMGTLNLSSGREPATEGETLELTCNMTSSSLPAAYRPNIIYISWLIYLAPETTFSEPIPFLWTPEMTTYSGPLLDPDGNIIPGYMTKNNGRTLVISSVQYFNRYVGCKGGEEERHSDVHFSNCFLDKECHIHHVEIRYKPYIYTFNPLSKKFNVAYGKTVDLRIEWESNPIMLPNRSWEFVNRNGVSQNLPPNSDCSQESDDKRFGYAWLRFNFTSSEFYGNYSFNVTNDIGSTTFTLEVLPEGPPDAPSNVKIKNVTHNAIVIQWNVMWSNSYEHRQTVYWRLNQTENETTVEDSFLIYGSDDRYNKSYSHRLRKNIQPKTNYTLSVWSVNKFGSSDVVELQVRTPKRPKLIATTISAKETEESISFTAQRKNEDLNSIDRDDKNSLLFAVIALALLLGIISMACLTVCLMRRFRTKRQLLPTAHYQGIIKPPVIEESFHSHEDNVYEELEGDEHFYAMISLTRNEVDDYENTI